MSVNFVNIPTELKQNASFCLWKKEKESDRVPLYYTHLGEKPDILPVKKVPLRTTTP